MQARVVAFIVWALVAASAMFWLLRLTGTSPTAPAHTVAVGSGAVPRGDLTRVFGAAPSAKSEGPVAAVPALASRFKLLGVAAPREGGDRVGLALIAVDGKPARGYRVGAAVDGDIVLQSVHPRGAALGARGAAPSVQLDLPVLPPPTTGVRPPALPGGGVAMSGPVLPPPSVVAAPQPVPFEGSPPPPQAEAPVLVPPPPGQVPVRQDAQR